MTLARNYVMKVGDDSRRIRIILKENNAILSAQPDSAKLRLKLGSGVVEKDLTLVDGGWEYHVTDADFTAWGTGNISCEVKATKDGEVTTYPTKGFITISIFAALT